MKNQLSLLNPNALVYLSFFILLNNFILFTAFDWGLSSEDGIAKTVARLISAFFLIIFLFIKREINVYYLFLPFLILFLFLMNGNVLALNVLYIVLFAACLSKMKVDVVMNIFLYLYLYALIFHNLFLYFGFINNNLTEVEGRLRYTFGFVNVNGLGMFYFYLYIICLYMIFKDRLIRPQVILYLPLIAISWFYIYFSGSRTALFCGAIAALLFVVVRFNILTKWLRCFLNFLFPICFLISILMSTDYAVRYNDLLSLRPLYFNYFFSELIRDDYSLIFGMKMTADMLVDNSYLLFLGATGLVFSMLFVFISPLISFKSNVENKYLPLLYSVLIYGIFESNIIRIELLVPIAMIYILFFCKFDNCSSETTHS